MDERRARREQWRSALSLAWEKLDRARLGRRANDRSWFWRWLLGREWAGHVVRRRRRVSEVIVGYHLALYSAEKEHAWMVLNQNVDRRLANWIRARHGQGPYTPPRPPPSEVEAAWAAYMAPGKDGDGRRLERDPSKRPIPRGVSVPPAERVPGAPSPGILLFEGVIERVEQEPNGRFVALHRLPDSPVVERILITDAQARALAERLAAEEAEDPGAG